MTLEFENPPLLSNIALNSSYNNEKDFGALDRVRSKKTSVISVTRRESLLAREELQEKREMSGEYSDNYDSYDDDFDSPSATKNATRSRRYSSRRESRTSERAQSTSRSPSDSPPKQRSRSKKASTRRDSFASYRSAYGTNRGPLKNKPKKSQSASSKMTTKTTGGESSMMRRVLSANKHKVSRLYNILEELQQEVEELKDENKSLKRVSHRQEKQIKKIDEEEASLPMLLQRHSAEMRTLKERMRKNQEVLHKKERESKDRDAEIQKLRDQVKNFRALSQDRKLEERAALAKKLENVQDEIATKDKKILDLQKAIALKDKTRQREMKDQKDRYKQAKEELKRVQEDFRSLRERLKEKERELDEKNIYHQHIVQKKKRGPDLPALPAGSQDIHAPAVTAPAVHIEKTPDTKKKRTNVFLTNAASDSGSVVTDEGRDTDEKSEKVSVKHEHPVVSKQMRHDEVFQVDGKEDEGRKMRDPEERRRREEEADQRRRMDEEERRKKEEEEKRREEEHAQRLRAEEEQLRKQREDQERARKQKEEEDKKRFEEEAEIRRKKDLLLARMRAIDVGNEKPDAVTATGGTSGVPVEDKPKKLPIFLQSDKPVKTVEEPSKPLYAANPDDDVLSDTSSGRKKLSASSRQSRFSYDFKQTVENLHQGLPAHAAQEGVKPEAQKPDTKDSLSDDLSFGSYKPTLGRRAATKRDNKDDLSFGGYNPSFGSQKETTRKNSGLNFGAGKKNATEKEQNGVIFGDYNPSFGAASSKPAASSQPNGDIGGKTSPPRGRRPRAHGGKPASLFDDDLFANEEVKPTGNPLFGDRSVKKDTSSYPWENKVNVTRSKESQEDSLLPRRKHLQSIGKSTEKNVRAVDNALDDIDDEIEEVIL